MYISIQIRFPNKFQQLSSTRPGLALNNYPVPDQISPALSVITYHLSLFVEDNIRDILYFLYMRGRAVRINTPG